VFILAMVILGGMGNIWGVVLGAVVLSMIDRFLLKELNGVPDAVGLDFDLTSINFGIFGFLLLTMMVLRPEGLIPSSRRKLELHGAGADPSDPIATAGDDELYEVRND
jgi:branched-chain amino acid transport system permease protein